MRLNYDKYILIGGISIIESNNNDMAVGDRSNQDGPALGRFQIHQSAWIDIDKLRRARGETIYPYHKAHDPVIAESYATTLVDVIMDQFIKHYGYRPSPAMLYACYSLGPSFVSKIPFMCGTKSYGIGPDKLVVATSMEATLWGLGYSTSLSKRKAKQAQKYENLIVAHYLSVRDLGIRLIK